MGDDGVLMAAGVQLPRNLATVYSAATAALNCGRVDVEAGALVVTEDELEALDDEELDATTLLDEDEALDELDEATLLLATEEATLLATEEATLLELVVVLA
ncbi:hypothetical protein GCM10025770_00070 [Viridibacterium curvum]|uniref:Uncharacterized protein n=1 Tax=Viridibacterium curvum TaxID=1101404 RepID=A0ABP9Q5Y2_9RHOO